MKLPENFSFSQQNLQDYLTCRYRFLLKYIRNLAWPAVESEPVLLQEARMELGQQFHRIVQQYFAGIDQNLLASTIQDEILSEWWLSFTSLNLIEFAGQKTAEKILTIPFSNHRLVAKYDLLIEQEGGKFTIYDWKTSQYLPSRPKLAKRMQTIVYPFVLQSTLSNLQKPDTSSYSIEMVYWFTAHPLEPVRFAYSSTQAKEDQDFLAGIINQICTNDEEWFTKTPEIDNCKFCRYRSLCERGISAGQIAPDEDMLLDESAFDIDFDSL